MQEETGGVRVMEIPKYIDVALRRRTKAAVSFNTNDYIISQWIDKNGLQDDVDLADYHGGCESIVNPYDAEMRIRKAIKVKE